MKKTGLFTLLVVSLLAIAIAFPVMAAGPKSPAVAAPAAAQPNTHPHIDEALDAMRAAKKHLQTAEHDFKGHRSKAVYHLDEAIKEAEICLNMKDNERDEKMDKMEKK